MTLRSCLIGSLTMVALAALAHGADEQPTSRALAPADVRKLLAPSVSMDSRKGLTFVEVARLKWKSGETKEQTTHWYVRGDVFKGDCTRIRIRDDIAVHYKVRRGKDWYTAFLKDGKWTGRTERADAQHSRRFSYLTLWQNQLLPSNSLTLDQEIAERPILRASKTSDALTVYFVTTDETCTAIKAKRDVFGSFAWRYRFVRMKDRWVLDEVRNFCTEFNLVWDPKAKKRVKTRNPEVLDVPGETLFGYPLKVTAIRRFSDHVQIGNVVVATKLHYQWPKGEMAAEVLPGSLRAVRIPDNYYALKSPPPFLGPTGAPIPLPNAK